MNQTVKRTAPKKTKVEVKMRAFGWKEVLVMFVAIQVLSPACGGQTGVANNVIQEIRLEYSPQGINISPWEAIVEGHGQPVTVRWIDTTPQPGKEEATPIRKWELRWAPAKPSDGPAFKDYFGAVDFSTFNDSGDVVGQGLEIEEDVWPYSVTLLEKVETGWQVLAFRDPRIRWRR